MVYLTYMHHSYFVPTKPNQSDRISLNLAIIFVHWTRSTLS